MDKPINDDYCPMRMFRRDVFNVTLSFLESKSLTAQEIVDGLKNCLEFFVDGADNDTVRDFCVAKLRAAELRMRG